MGRLLLFYGVDAPKTISARDSWLRVIIQVISRKSGPTNLCYM